MSYTGKSQLNFITFNQDCISMIRLLFSTALVLLSFSGHAKKEPKTILFIGNSLTYFNDMPQTLQKMFEEQNDNYVVDQRTPPGESLAGHVSHVSIGTDVTRRANPGETPTTIERLLSKKWDIVVLQEGTVQCLVPESRRYCFMPAVKMLDSIVRSRGGKTVLYQAYPLQPYPKQYCYPAIAIKMNMPVKKNVSLNQTCCSREYQGYEDEYSTIDSVYKAAARMGNIGLARVGYAFKMCRQKHPEIQLYADDDHPSPQGSLLMACVFYKYFTHKKTVQIQYNAEVKEEEAFKIKELVDEMP